MTARAPEGTRVTVRECVASRSGEHEPMQNNLPTPARFALTGHIPTAFHSKRPPGEDGGGKGNGMYNAGDVAMALGVHFCRACGCLYVPKDKRR